MFFIASINFNLKPVEFDFYTARPHNITKKTIAGAMLTSLK